MSESVLTAPSLGCLADRLDLVRSLWREVLAAEAVADDVNFFDAGGDSLLLVALVERIRQATARPVKTMDVLRAGTVTGHAALLETPAPVRS